MDHEGGTVKAFRARALDFCEQAGKNRASGFTLKPNVFVVPLFINESGE